MELIVITTLCMSLSIMLTHSASHQIQVKSHEQAHELQLSLPTLLPRKLRLLEEATLKTYGSKEFVSYNKKKGSLSGKVADKEETNMMHARRGTHQEWVELEGRSDSDMSEFFTMDYSGVKRRRPIHNKSLTFSP